MTFGSTKHNFAALRLCERPFSPYLILTSQTIPKIADMKYTLLIAFISLASYHASAQSKAIENVIIVTTDGFRWQEVFSGMDAEIAADRKSNQGDSAGIFSKYWSADPGERRSKLLPFIWNTIATHGQIYGNRNLGVKVNNKNPYWFSYPGYSELFCGYVDTAINSNDYPSNPHTNLLEYLNKQPGYKGNTAAFTAWDAFDRILNEQRSGIPVYSGMDSYGGDETQQLLTDMKKDSYNAFGPAEALDVFTHYAALRYLQKNKPRVLYIAYGETDEWAHEGHYKDYLNAAHRVDKWLSDLWNNIQHDPKYRNKTLLFVTVDHGRGVGKEWTSHNNKIPYSNEIWFAVMGPGIAPKGEISKPAQLYQVQFAQTIATSLGLHFSCEHPVADGFKELLVK